MKKKKRKNLFSGAAPYIILVVALLTVWIFAGSGSKQTELSTGELIQALKKGEVTEITITP